MGVADRGAPDTGGRGMIEPGVRDPQRPFLDAGALASRLPRLPLPGGPVAAPTLVVGLLAPFGVRWWPAATVWVVLAGALLGLLLVTARGTDPLGWLMPPALRAVEYGGILALAWREGTPPSAVAGFLLVAVVAYHHYDTVYRDRALGTLPPDWLVATLGGFEGRLAVLLLGTAVGHTTTVLWVLVVWCGTLSVTESVRWWHRAT